jgi:hypothetical protein
MKMALLRKPEFEKQTDSDNSAAPEVAATAAAEKPATAVAVAKPTAVAVAASTDLRVDVFNKFHNAEKVDFNTLKRIQAKSSGFVMQDANNDKLGDTLDFELISYQASYVISPGADGPEASKAVRYSDDGVTTKAGENVTEYLAQVKLDFPKAKLNRRMVVVLDLLKASNGPASAEKYCENEPYQMDLAPSSVANFEQYISVANFKVRKGRLGADKVGFIRAVVSETSGLVEGAKKDYQIVNFTTLEA